MPKPPTKLAEVMITTYYGKRPLRWIGDQLGCSAPTVLAYAKRLGLSQPTPDKQRGRKPLVPVLPIAPTVVSPTQTTPSSRRPPASS